MARAYVNGVEISNYRGIRKGVLESLSPMSVLVGRNNSGKSSVLEALYVGHSTVPVERLPLVVNRRGWFGPESIGYLFYQGAAEAQVEVRFIDAPLGRVRVELEIPKISDINEINRSKAQGLEEPLVQINATMQQYREKSQLGAWKSVITFDKDGDNSVPWVASNPPRTSLATRFIDNDTVRDVGNPEDLYSAVLKVDRVGRAVTWLKAVAPSLKDVLLAKEGAVTVLQHRFEGRTLPYYVAGDGLKKLTLLALMAAHAGDGLLLLEEPECYQHPGVLAMCAKVLWSAAEDGLQLVLSTHSQEFLDALLQEMNQVESRAKDFSVFRVKLHEGVLQSVRLAGNEALTEREAISADLRG